MNRLNKFYLKKFCDRCGKPLNGYFTMSSINFDTICVDCKMKEQINKQKGLYNEQQMDKSY